MTALERAGRTSTDDSSDLLGLLTLGFVLVPLNRVFRRHPLRPSALLWKVCLVLAWLWPLRRLELGVDLRMTPPIPHRIPREWLRLIAGLGGMVAALAIAAPYFPHAAREFLGTRFYLGYLVLLGGLWVTMGAAVVLSAFIAWAALHDWFVEAYRGQARRPIGREMWLSCGLMIGLMVASVVLPRWFPLVAYAALFALHTIAPLLASRGLVLLWRHRRGGPVHSFDGRIWVWGQGVIPLLALLGLVLLSRGDSLVSSSSAPQVDSMPLTSALGEALIWSSLAGLCAWTFALLRYVVLGIAFNPDRPPLPIAWIDGTVDRRTFARLARWFRERRWRLLHGKPPVGTTYVPIHPAGSPDASGAGFDDGATLVLPQGTAPSVAWMDRLARREEIQNRRALKRGLEMLFKRAARRSRSRGTGYWVAPQHWFILGIDRDVNSSDDNSRESSYLTDLIGPPFHRVFPARARCHFHQITTALAVDLIFVEDGVSYRRFARVLSMMFEVYDVYGGRQQAEEKHFTGLPGVRVVLHDFTIEESTTHGARGYPEPDYEQLGRARILHVFRDRGESEEEAFAPRDFEGMPVLSGA